MYLNDDAPIAGGREIWGFPVSGFCMGLVLVPMSTLAVQSIGSDRQDEASGISGVARSPGSSDGIAIVGRQVASRTRFHWTALGARLTPSNPDVRSHLAPMRVARIERCLPEILAGKGTDGG